MNDLAEIVLDVAKLVNVLAGAVAELAAQAERPDLVKKVYDALEPSGGH